MTSPEEASAWVRRLPRTSTDPAAAEREDLAFLLAMAAGGMLSGPAFPRPEGVRENAPDSVRHSVPKPPAGVRKNFPTGIVFHGRGSFLSDAELAALDRESRDYRPRAERLPDHCAASGAPVAGEVSRSPAIHAFLTEKVGAFAATRRARYLYYDEPGRGGDPHVEPDACALHILTLLEHRPPSGHGPVRQEEPARSELILHPPDLGAVRLRLRAGESLVFFAGSVTHRRTRTVADERVRLVSFGYRVLGDPQE